MEISIMTIFEMGMDYGLLKAEEERDNEMLGIASYGSIYAGKTAMPMKNDEWKFTRQPRSESWREPKKKSFENFQDLLVGIASTDELIFIKEKLL